MLIKVLAENTAISEEFKFEHGLSLYVETKKHKLLFDVGQTDLFLENAEKMGVNIKNVDTVVISHAHYDHTGGLKTFLKINKKAKIYINENVVGDFYNSSNKYIGMDKSVLDDERFIFTKDELIIDDELYLFTGNKSEKPHKSESAYMTTLKDGVVVEDTYEHEQYLIITQGKKKALLTGCSHKGILNILDFSEHMDITALIGGFHLKVLEEEKSMITILFDLSKLLNREKLTYYTCHCTGLKQYEVLKKAMQNRLSYISSGQIIKI